MSQAFARCTIRSPFRGLRAALVAVATVLAVALPAAFAVDLPSHGQVVLTNDAGTVVGHGELGGGSLELALQPDVNGFVTLTIRDGSGATVAFDGLVTAAGGLRLTVDGQIVDAATFAAQHQLAFELRHAALAGTPDGGSSGTGAHDDGGLPGTTLGDDGGSDDGSASGSDDEGGQEEAGDDANDPSHTGGGTEAGEDDGNGGTSAGADESHDEGTASDDESASGTEDPSGSSAGGAHTEDDGSGDASHDGGAGASDD